MNNLPGTIPPESRRVHPRRPPAHRSVSLRHDPSTLHAPVKATVVKRRPTTLSSPNPASDKANPPSVSPKLLSHKHSSGESSDAGRWFETTNNNAKQSDPSFAGNEPPFFLHNSSSSETPPDSGLSQHARVHPTIPYRPMMTRTGTDGSSTEDFRGVIDDLTVANKKLKRKLKKYERTHNAHLQEDKLFEVRFHGLPDHKKKELEETLRKFAAGLDDEAYSDYPPVQSHVPALDHHKSASSTSRFAESGYASMSRSGQNSSATSNQASNQPSTLLEDTRKTTRSAYNHQQQSIQSYLHDIPVGLLPSSTVPMTDKKKKKLVVRRLEQIFAGKQSMPGTHSQPMQQEEVAQSAATADREQREATGRQHRPEGLRVARIMPEQSLEGEKPEVVETLHRFRPGLHRGEQDFAGSGSPDQRPTRPLDLDLYRAQVPFDNMDYIRHLGFTPPDMHTGQGPLADRGWIYLNLLVNMAQLHTLSVTPEFIKDALTDYSSHLELSRDGRKIRWKGGLEVTRDSSDSPSDGAPDGSFGPHGSPSKHLRTGESGGSTDPRIDSEQELRRIARANREKERNKFAYTPMFFRKESEDDESSYGFDAESSGASLQPPAHAGNSSGFSSTIIQGGPSSRNRNDGPMIFYTRAKFCTDLSGDHTGTSLMPGAYQTITSHPLGVTLPPFAAAQRAYGLTEPRGPMEATPMEIDSNNGSRTALSDEYFGFSPATMSNDTSGSDSSADVVNFEVSGLGGVQPEDNFSIRVRRAQLPTVSSVPTHRRRSSVYPQNIMDALAGASDEETTPHPPRIIREEIMSASRRTLPASELPPASFLPFDSTSSGDVDSDLDSYVSSEVDSESGEGPATALQILNMHPGQNMEDSDSDSEASQYSEDTDDGSVDFLATARQLDPNTIRNQEREYDAALADRLADEIVAGSSAATACGGSGFNTPAGVVGFEHDGGSVVKNPSITSGSISSRSQLKRSRTSELNGLNKRKSQKTE
ncbi:frequency clock protein [Phaeosphaeria sp. MPI-PUGE-AT-0046c]|nr:frequency clock protein [Phaeosphaeria sp. MPI-PUGE-AT-0046c]